MVKERSEHKAMVNKRRKAKTYLLEVLADRKILLSTVQKPSQLENEAESVPPHNDVVFY